MLVRTHDPDYKNIGPACRNVTSKAIHAEPESQAKRLQRLRLAVLDNDSQYVIKQFRIGSRIAPREWDQGLNYAASIGHVEVAVAIIFFGPSKAHGYRRLFLLLRQGCITGIALLMETNLEWLSALMDASEGY